MTGVPWLGAEVLQSLPLSPLGLLPSVSVSLCLNLALLSLTKTPVTGFRVPPNPVC